MWESILRFVAIALVAATIAGFVGMVFWLLGNVAVMAHYTGRFPPAARVRGAFRVRQAARQAKRRLGWVAILVSVLCFVGFLRLLVPFLGL